MMLARLDKLGSREKTLLVLAVVMVLAVLSDRLVVQRVADGLRELDAAVEIERSNLAYSGAVLAGGAAVREAYDGVRDAIGRAASPAADIDVLKGEIDDLARKSGLLLRSMKHREPRNGPYYSEYIVDIGDFEGSMESLLTFLHAVRSSADPGLLSVARLTVGAGRDGEAIKGAMTLTKVVAED